MENLHKIVADRLKADSISVDHPDANLLTAFSERTLGERERSQVLEHLARCAECREVVVLALPADEQAGIVVRPASAGLLKWPQLRWALVAAGVLVVGSFGILRYRAASHPETVALFDSRSTADAATEANRQAEAAPAPLPAAKPEEEKPQTHPSKSSSVGARDDADAESREFDRLEQFGKLEAPRRDEKSGMVSGTEGGYGAGRVRPQTLAHGPKGPVQQFQQNLNVNSINNANSSNAGNEAYHGAAPAAPPMAAKQAAAGVVVSAQSQTPAPATSTPDGSQSTDKKDQNLDVAANSRSVSLLGQSGAKVGGEVARAKPAEPTAANTPASAAAEAYTISATTAGNFATSGPLVPESARWAINSAGGLQRSFDQGRTWQDVDVNGLEEAGAATADMQLAMKTRRSKALAKEKVDRKVAAVVFRAVSANGPDVWAGGSEGNLYHSNDSGAHWVRVFPSWRGVQLTGDIVNLQFADPQHGRIITSSAEIWMTADAGQTWDKQ
jgi:hypothetical protein